VADDKLSRQVTLVCPSCGCSQFSHADEGEEDGSIVTCAQCGRRLTRDELLRENSENVEAHAAEMAQEAISDAVKQFNKSLRDAFRGNKNIRFK
jgi:uncharacterized Zn finger protein (UPF0148 family)